MQTNELFFKSMFESATEGIIISNKTGEIELANQAAIKQFQYSMDEFTGLAIEDLLPDNFRKKHIGLRSGFIEKPENRPMGFGLELFGKRKSGDLFPLEISLTTIKVENEIKIISFIIDISKRKEIEAEVIKHQIELEEANQKIILINEQLEKKVGDRTKVLQEAIKELERYQNELKFALIKEKELNDLKSRFISMASHEFRTPLTTILSSASLIGEYSLPDQNDKKNKHVSRIKSGVSNLNDILSDFLSISKLEEGKTQPSYKAFNLQDLVYEIVSDFKLQLKENQSIKNNYNGTAVLFQDAKLIKNILINLISNAMKFSNDNGEISVSCSITVDSIEIVVSDSGIGISDDDKNHMFERFFRAKNASNIQGTGLGLHIVSNYLTLLNGTIKLDSELNVGTTITVTLPKIQNHENHPFN